MHKLNQKHRPNCHEAKTEKEGPTQGLTWHNETSEIQMNVVFCCLYYIISCVVHIHRLGSPKRKPHHSKGAFRQVAIMLTNFWSSLVCFAHCAGRQHDGKPWEMEIRKVMKDHVCVALVSISHLSRYHICSLSLSPSLCLSTFVRDGYILYRKNYIYIYIQIWMSLYINIYIYIHVYVNYIYHTQK